MSNRKRTISKLLFLGHRYVGLGCAVFVVMLAITGMMLNHTEQLKMDERHIHSPMLLDWYGIQAPDITSSFPVGGHWLTELGDKLYLDSQVVTTSEGILLGAMSLGDIYIAAYSSALFMISAEGELIERIYDLPSEIERLGVESKHQLPVLHTKKGDFIADRDMFEWHSDGIVDVAWVKTQTLSTNLSQEILKSYRGNGLSVERVVLDLHSGRIAGTWGVLLMDVVAFLFLLLAGAGVWLWMRR